MKIVTIGAGSIVWGSQVTTDFLLNPNLDGAELMLMDVNADSLALVKGYLERLVREQSFAKTIRATTDLREALKGADYVMVAVSVGGDRLWRYDAMFPQIEGIYQPVGDTTGPGGLIRSLRHAPVMLEIGRTMLEVSNPGAVMIQLTNPMNPLCAALEQLEGLTVYGVCHGVNDTEQIFAQQLGVPPETVRVKAAGNNHNIFCTQIQVGDEIYTPERFDLIAHRLFDTTFRKEVYERYRGLVGNHSRHPIEFLPGFLNAESGFGRAWGVEPVPAEIDPFQAPRHDQARMLLERVMSQPEPIGWRDDRRHQTLAPDSNGIYQTGHTREILDDFVVALEQGHDFDIHLNIANQGAIAGIGDAFNVEIPVQFRQGRLVRPAITFNAEITQVISRVAQEQYLIAQACLEFNQDLLVEALSLDALVPSREVAERLVREMVSFQANYILTKAFL